MIKIIGLKAPNPTQAIDVFYGMTVSPSWCLFLPNKNLLITHIFVKVISKMLKNNFGPPNDLTGKNMKHKGFVLLVCHRGVEYLCVVMNETRDS